MYRELAIAIVLQCEWQRSESIIEDVYIRARARGRFDGFTEGVLTTMIVITAWLTFASITGVI